MIDATFRSFVIMTCLVICAHVAPAPTIAASQDIDRRSPVLIPGGTFIMGTDAAQIAELKRRYGVTRDGAFTTEIAAHEVTVSSFRIDRYEVTNRRFAGFVRENPQWARAALADAMHNGNYLADWQGGTFPSGKAEHPVVFVTWHAAFAFCAANGGWLPSEAEWEYVARAGGDQEFPWGDELPTPEDANYGGSGIDTTTAVGTYPPNAFGVHDLAGNVWEFLLDAWEAEYESAPRRDPVAGGLVDESSYRGVEGRRAVRGASYGGSVTNLRTRWRDSHVATNAIGFVGFRCGYPATDE